jgi:hypothetical protein
VHQVPRLSLGTPTAYARIRTNKDNSDIYEARAVIQLFLEAVHGLDAERTQPPRQSNLLNLHERRSSLAKIAEVLVETLVAAGVKRAYGVAGDPLNGMTGVNPKA